MTRAEELHYANYMLIGIPLAIAFGTVLWQTLKAARTNPATELKKE